MDIRFDTPIDGESPRAFECFQAYLKMPTPRSIEKLCQANINGKKSVSRTLYRYSSDYHWVERAEAFDKKQAQEAFDQLVQKRQEEVNAFTDIDFEYAQQIQGLVGQKLVALQKADEVDWNELRRVVMVYRETRVWIQELLGLISDDERRAESETS